MQVLSMAPLGRDANSLFTELFPLLRSRLRFFPSAGGEGLLRLRSPRSGLL